MSDTPRGVAVTGMGCVTPYGTGSEKLFRALVEGRVAVGPTQDERLHVHCPVSSAISDFDPTHWLPEKLVRDTSRFTQLTLVAAMEAIAEAKLAVDENGHLQAKDGRSERIGIFMGTGFGGIATMEEGAAGLAVNPDYRVGPRLVSKSVPNAAAGALAAFYAIYGPVLTYATACASSANAIGEAMLWLESGRIDLAIAGGTDSLLAPAILAGLRESGALAVRGTGPVETWSRPFDKHRIGMVPGEGAAVLVLERVDDAVARGARIRAQVVGYGTSNDGYHQIAPEPHGRGAALAIRQALASARLQPSEIDFINAHATATKAGDAAEAMALRDVFGERYETIPVNAIKGHIGHVLGGAGAIESIACICSLETGWLPPTLHCDELDDGAPPNLVRRHPRRLDIHTALSTSFGFGGQNGVLIFRKG